MFSLRTGNEHSSSQFSNTEKAVDFYLGDVWLWFCVGAVYEKICEVTGINNLLQADTLAENTQVDTARWVTVELDANTRGLPWQFRPLQSNIRVHPGELVQVMYEVKNNSDREINGQAIPSYSPQLLAKHLKAGVLLF